MFIFTEFKNSGTTSAPNFYISSTASTNTVTITTHSITKSTEYSMNSISSTVTLTTTTTTTTTTSTITISTSGGLSFATTTTSTNTMFINSPTLSTSQSDSRIDFSSVGVIAVIAALVIVSFVIITVVVVGLVVVYRKRKRNKPYNEQGDVDSTSSTGGASQRFSNHRPEISPLDGETVEQDNKDHQYVNIPKNVNIPKQCEHSYVNIPENMEPSKQESRAPENVYSVPHCHIKMEPNPAYKPTTGTIRVSDVKYY